MNVWFRFAACTPECLIMLLLWTLLEPLLGLAHPRFHAVRNSVSLHFFYRLFARLAIYPAGWFPPLVPSL